MMGLGKNFYDMLDGSPSYRFLIALSQAPVKTVGQNPIQFIYFSSNVDPLRD